MYERNWNRHLVIAFLKQICESRNEVTGQSERRGGGGWGFFPLLNCEEIRLFLLTDAFTYCAIM